MPDPIHAIIPRLPGELDAAYDALIRWARMEPADRSQSALARQLGVARQTVIRWHQKYEWPARAGAWDIIERRTLDITPRTPPPLTPAPPILDVPPPALKVREDAPTVSGEVIRTIEAYERDVAQATRAATSCALSLYDLVGKRLASLTEAEIAEINPRHLPALLTAAHEAHEVATRARGELYGIHQYLEFLSEHAAPPAHTPAAPIPAHDEGED